jgi:hypothetical protein
MSSTFAALVAAAKTSTTSEDDYTIIRELADLQATDDREAWYIQSARSAHIREDDRDIVSALAELA